MNRTRQKENTHLCGGYVGKRQNGNAPGKAISLFHYELHSHGLWIRAAISRVRSKSRAVFSNRAHTGFVNVKPKRIPNVAL